MSVASAEVPTGCCVFTLTDRVSRERERERDKKNFTSTERTGGELSSFYVIYLGRVNWAF